MSSYNDKLFNADVRHASLRNTLPSLERLLLSSDPNYWVIEPLSIQLERIMEWKGEVKDCPIPPALRMGWKEHETHWQTCHREMMFSGDYYEMIHWPYYFWRWEVGNVAAFDAGIDKAYLTSKDLLREFSHGKTLHNTKHRSGVGRETQVVWLGARYMTLYEVRTKNPIVDQTWALEDALAKPEDSYKPVIYVPPVIQVSQANMNPKPKYEILRVHRAY